MALTILQQSDTFTGNTTSCFVNIATVNPGEILVAWGASNTATPSLSISDNAGGSWTLAVSSGSANDAVWWRRVTAAGSVGVTLSQTPSAAAKLTVYRISGAKFSNPIGSTFSASGAAGNTQNFNFQTTVANSTFIIGAKNSGTNFGIATYSSGTMVSAAGYNIASGTNLFAGAVGWQDNSTTLGTTVVNLMASTGSAVWGVAGVEIVPETIAVTPLGQLGAGTAGANVSVSSVTFPAGSLGVASVSSDYAIANVTDSASNTWTLQSSNSVSSIYTCYFASSTTCTVSMTTSPNTSAGNRTIQVHKVTGVHPSTPVVGGFSATGIAVSKSITFTSTAANSRMFGNFVATSTTNSPFSNDMFATSTSTVLVSGGHGGIAGAEAFPGTASGVSGTISASLFSGVSWGATAIEILPLPPTTVQSVAESLVATDDNPSLARTIAGETLTATDATTLITPTIQNVSESGWAATEASVMNATFTDSETFAAADAAIIGYVAWPVTESASATDDVPQLVVQFVVAESFALADDNGTLVDQTLYVFSPPGIAGERDRTHPLWQRIRHEVGIAVLKIGGLYRQVQAPSPDEIASATEVYLGGHVHAVDAATKDALTDAGYGTYLRAEDD